MVVVFLAFLTANQVFLKLIGIGLATAIFVDDTPLARGRAADPASGARAAITDSAA
jgi:hypothetical protein